ncbi:MAG: glycine--tRNA ligase [Candidatus Woesearchaeota archaeon]
MVSIDELATFCKRKGFVFPSSEIYGGMSGVFDLGHLGVEFRNKIRAHWWSTFVKQRDDMYGIEGSVLSHPNIWKASGHVDNFGDLLIQDTVTKENFRADHLVEDVLKIPTDGLDAKQLQELIEKHDVKSPKGNPLSEIKVFSPMFETFVGPFHSEESKSYLRPETAQIIFAQFKNMVETNRVKLPFGIAQIGKSFRNEISPRNFIFRMREFEQAEIEYFIDPAKYNSCPYIAEVLDNTVVLNTQDCQANDTDPITLTIKEALDKKVIRNEWHAYFMGLAQGWFVSLGVSPENLRFRQHRVDELSHYSSDTWDLEYKFEFGFKELWGIADRSTYDLDQHIKHSGQKLSVFDEESKSHIIPRVLEPSLGFDRTFLVLISEALRFDEERKNNVLALHPKIAPVTVGIFPLVKKDGLAELAYDIYKNIRKQFDAVYDVSGSVGKRYARMDEIGTPFCVTVDFETKEDQCVTIRYRDSMKQERVAIADLQNHIMQKLNEGA